MVVFDISCQITREQRARNSFRRQHIGEHCPFKLNTSQNCSVEFGYIDNPRNGEVVLDDTIVRLRHLTGRISAKSREISPVFFTRRVVDASKCHVPE